MIENRRHQRAVLDVTVEFARKGSDTRLRGRAKDISLGGMFIETDQPLEFASNVTVLVTLPGQKQGFMLPGVVRWNRDGGMGIQFGLIGARETHAITELTLGK
ncbi:MAG TPA: PilZ domain-containing protein [Polyangiaceae bacterium]|nr:PilZ domain-containing protein [Polyangiaceae bacterium]